MLDETTRELCSRIAGLDLVHTAEVGNIALAEAADSEIKITRYPGTVAVPLSKESSTPPKPENATDSSAVKIQDLSKLNSHPRDARV